MLDYRGVENAACCDLTSFEVSEIHTFSFGTLVRMIYKKIKLFICNVT